MDKTKNKKILLAVISWLVLFSFSLSLAKIIVVTPKTERDAARDLAQRWIINNHENNPSDYKLEQKVLRQELAAITRWVAKIEKVKKCENIFKDLSNIVPNTWACLNVEALVKHNFIARNVFFRPEAFVTKSETLWMLIKAIWFDYSYNPKSKLSWQEQLVNFAVKKGIIEKFDDFNSLATRWFVFKIAWVKLIEVPDEKERKKPEVKIEKQDFFSSEIEIK
jgi:hypothetical protein